MSDENPPGLAEDEVRELLNRWAEGGYFRLRYFGDKIFIDEIVPGVAYTVQLQTHYEQRNVRQASTPYHGGAVDSFGRPPQAWEISVPKPAAFEERSQVVPIPHTERVQMCGQCAGEGRVACSLCMGQGRRTCPWCNGRGFRETMVMDTGRDAQGNPVSQPRAMQSACSCAGGMVSCSQCGGNGVVRCSSCAGSGRVKTFDQLVVRFQSTAQAEILDVTPVPDAWLGKLTGEVLTDEKATRIDSCDGLPESPARTARELLAKSHDVDEQTTRIVLQALHVERLPLHEVRYKYAGVERRVWICGNERGIHAPNAPYNRGRWFTMIGGVVLGVSLAIGAAVWLLASL